MKEIRIILEDDEYKRMKKDKNGKSWKHYLTEDKEPNKTTKQEPKDFEVDTEGLW